MQNFYYFVRTDKSFSFLTFNSEIDMKKYIGENKNDLTIPNTMNMVFQIVNEPIIEESSGEYNEFTYYNIKKTLKELFDKDIDSSTFKFNCYSEEVKKYIDRKR